MQIFSILDNDLYKFSMSHAYMNLYPLAEGTFTFTDRSKETWTSEQVAEVKYEISALAGLKLSEEEFKWCVKNIPYIPESYWEWLRQFRFDPKKVNVSLDEERKLHIDVTDKLYRVTMYEIPVLAIVSAIRNSQYKWNRDEVIRIAKEKAHYALSNNLKFADFGTRRRFNTSVQEIVLETLFDICPTLCSGTSNVAFAKKFGVKPIGTMAHEWIMFHAGCFGFQRANYLSMEDWIKVYDGNLGIALIDTYTTDSFLRTLTLKEAKLLDGMRQDSGDEFMVGNKIIKRYNELGIDPKSKTIVFSNALNFEKYKEITEYFKGRINVSAGIGTFLTCDMGIDGFKPANIVMKLTRVRLSPKDPWENVIKISDDMGKHMGDPKKFEIAINELHLNID